MGEQPMFDPNIKLIPTNERPGAQGEKICSERLCEKKRTILCYQELCRTSVSDCNKIVIIGDSSPTYTEVVSGWRPLPV